MRDTWPSRWFRPVVSVEEMYRTKRGQLVGEATLACGHTTLVDMDRRAVRRACWSCKVEGRTAWRVALSAAPEPSDVR